MRGDNEGPTVIPAHTTHVPEQRTCSGCKYFKSHTTMIGGCFGGQPRREGYTECRHPEAMTYNDDQDGQIRLKTPDIGIPKIISRWTLGTEHDVTPDWCPYIKKESSDASNLPSPAPR